MIIKRNLIYILILPLTLFGCGKEPFAKSEIIYEPIFPNANEISFIFENNDIFQKSGEGPPIRTFETCNKAGFKCLGGGGVMFAIPWATEAKTFPKTWFVNETEFWIEEETAKETEAGERSFFFIGSAWKPSKEVLAGIKEAHMKTIKLLQRELDDEEFEALVENEEKEKWRKYFFERIIEEKCEIKNIGEYPPIFFSYDSTVGVEFIIIFKKKFDDNCNLIFANLPQVYKLKGRRGILGPKKPH